MEDLQEAYQEVEGTTPVPRTVYRILKRLQILFDPLAYEEDDDNTQSEEELADAPMGIKRIKRNRKTYYLFQGDLTAPSMDINEALLTALSLYPQHRGLLKDAFREIMEKLLRDVLLGLSSYVRLIQDIDSHVYVAEPAPRDYQKQGHIISSVFEAIRDRNKLWIKYLRTYDGAVTERTVEPYGLLCRFNNWYLTGSCLQKKERRLFLLSNIREMKILEKTSFQMPTGYSIKKEYSRVWAVHTSKKNMEEEKVCLWVSRGVAERFRTLNFHQTQLVKELGNGDIEVTFNLAGADEMIPWLISWGSGIKVVEPRWLYRDTVEALERTLEHYRQE